MSRLEARDHRFATDNLSRYLDGALSAKDAERIEHHLSVCDECSQASLDLQRTCALLRLAPVRPMPRSFVLPESSLAQQTSYRRWTTIHGTLRTASVAVTFMLVLLISGDYLVANNRLPLGAPAPQAPREALAVADMPAPKPAREATGVSEVQSQQRSVPAAPTPERAVEKAAQAPRFVPPAPPFELAGPQSPGDVTGAGEARQVVGLTLPAPQASGAVRLAQPTGGMPATMQTISARSKMGGSVPQSEVMALALRGTAMALIGPSAAAPLIQTMTVHPGAHTTPTRGKVAAAKPDPAHAVAEDQPEADAEQPEDERSSSDSSETNGVRVIWGVLLGLLFMLVAGVVLVGQKVRI